MFKKFLSAASALVLAGCLCSCGSQNSAINDNPDKLKIVCTIFPEYDWTRQILGSHSGDVQLTYLLSNGADLHNYQPTADDMIRISDCDIFVYVGGESDSWVKEAISESRNPDLQVVSLMDMVGDNAKEEEIKEGMEAEDEEEESDLAHEEAEYDEHVWLSVRNAETCCKGIAEAVKKADSANSADYDANLSAYLDKLDKLDNDITDALAAKSEKTLIFGDRFPFRYFVDDYGLDYYAAFVGCSAETEASFETIAFLAKKADETGTNSIFAIEGSDCTIAEAVIANTSSKNQTIRVLDSAQSVNTQQIQDGASYISIMENNLRVLKEALK